MITLFPDQIDLIERTRQSMRSHKHVLMQAATGFGKTVAASYLVSSSQQKGKRSWFVVPRKELLVQTKVTFNNFEIPHSFVAAGWDFNPYSRTHICSVNTLINRLDKLAAPDFVIVDECHYGGAGLDKIIKWLRAKNCWVIGLSGTPWKLSGQGLGCWYDDMVCGPSIRWLIDNDRLSEYRIFAPNRPDLSGIKTVAGDYAKGELADRMEHDAVLIGDAVKYYKEHAMGKLGITYCVSRKHSRMTADKYNEAGIPAAHIDGETPSADRRLLIEALADGRLLQLCNAQLLTFGFDLAAQVGRDVSVEAMTDLAPTKSLALQRQKWGRVLRYKKEPAMIFDHASNVYMHGMPCDDIKWTLEDRKTKRGGEASEKTIATRSCPECFFVFKPAPSCPACGHEMPIQYREVEEIAGELAEIREAQLRADRKKEQAIAKTLDDLIDLGRQRGYKNPEFWAAKVISSRNVRRAQ